MKLTKEAREHVAKYGSGAAVVQAAMEILEHQIRRTDCIASPNEARSYLRLRLAKVPHEEFHAIWLDARNQVIEAECLFRGTLTQTSVYPREVVKAALRHNAAGVLLSHNHPSGNPEPSFQDQALTRSLTEALALIDVKVLDHVVVGGDGGGMVSFAERGLL